MTNENAENGRSRTRRGVLRGTVAGATAASGLATVASAEECEVTEEERRQVCDEYGNEEQLIEALQSLEGLRDAITDEGLVEGSDAGVFVEAPVYNCEVVPEYRIYREATENRNLSVQIRPSTQGSVTIQRASWIGNASIVQDPDDEDPWCDPVYNATGCDNWCDSDRCCSCILGYCDGSASAASVDPVCCYKCDCPCTSYNGCFYHCGSSVYESIDVTTGWWEEAILGRVSDG